MAVLLVPAPRLQQVGAAVVDLGGPVVIAQHERNQPDRILCIDHAPVAG